MKSSQFIFKVELLFCLLICIGIASIYGQVINYEFINFDDPLYVVNNPHTQQGLTTEGFKWAFSFQDKEDTYWHPITWLSHMADVTLFGNQSGLHHLINVIWHMLNTCILFLILHRTTRMFWFSAFTASFFAVHPLNVETVAWIAERKNLLSTFFWLLSIAAYVYYTRKTSFFRYVLLVIIYIAGLMTKPMLITLPFVFLLLDYWPLKQISFALINTEKKQSFSLKTVNQLVPRLLEKIPLLCIAILVLYLVTASLNENNNVITFSSIPLSLRIENLLVSYVSYLGKLIWPFDLAVFYPFPKSLSVTKVVISTLLLVSITLAILVPLREKKPITVGWLWFIGTLTPVSGLIQAGLWPAMADRWTYVPFIGLFIIISWCIQETINRQKHIWSISVAIFIITVLGTISWHQVHNWQNSTTLFSHTLAATYRNSVAHNNLGAALSENDQIEEAIPNYLKALQIRPNYFEAHNNLAKAYVKTGNHKNAIIHYRNAIKINAMQVSSIYNFANALMKTDQTEEAIQYYKQAQKQNPYDEKAHYNLGIALINIQRYDEAISNFQKAILIKPDYLEAHNNLANIFAEQQKIEQATSHYLKALEINPQSETSLINLANFLAGQNLTEEAVSYFTQYLLLHPEDSDAHYNIAMELTKLGKFQEAMDHYLQVIAVAPDHYESHNNLALLLVQLGNNKSAISHFNSALIIIPENAEIHYNLATSLAASGRAKEAKKHFTKALDIDPLFVNAHNNLGILLAQEKRTEEAVSHFAQALHIDPSSIDGHTNMGIILLNLGKTEKAHYHFNEAVKFSPKSHNLQRLLQMASPK